MASLYALRSHAWSCEFAEMLAVRSVGYDLQAVARFVAQLQDDTSRYFLWRLRDSFAMDWTEEKTLYFIKLYKQRDVLWNPSHPNHYNKKLRKKAWEDMAQKLGKTSEELKRKMNALSSSLRRERCKIRISKNARKGKQNSKKEYSVVCYLAFF